MGRPKKHRLDTVLAADLAAQATTADALWRGDTRQVALTKGNAAAAARLKDANPSANPPTSAQAHKLIEDTYSAQVRVLGLRVIRPMTPYRTTPLSREEVAVRAGVSPETFRAWEGEGVQPVSLEDQEKIMAAQREYIHERQWTVEASIPARLFRAKGDKLKRLLIETAEADGWTPQHFETEGLPLARIKCAEPLDEDGLVAEILRVCGTVALRTTPDTIGAAAIEQVRMILHNYVLDHRLDVLSATGNRQHDQIDHFERALQRVDSELTRERRRLAASAEALPELMIPRTMLDPLITALDGIDVSMLA